MLNSLKLVATNLQQLNLVFEEIKRDRIERTNGIP